MVNYPYPRPQAVKLKIKGDIPYPKNALAAVYDIFRDIETVNKAHQAKEPPPFAVKEFSRSGFAITSYLALPTNMVSDRLKAKGLFIADDPIYLPQTDLPPLYALKDITINFRTPTAFKYGPGCVPEFYAPIFIKSATDSYKRIIPGLPEFSVSGILKYIEFTDYNLQKSKYQLTKDLAIQGFKGRVCLRFKPTAVPELKLLTIYLLESASICGVGVKKAWGMGDVNIVF
jgi:hypothetical protein